MRCLYTVSEEVILCEGVARATYGIVAMREDGAVLARLPALCADRARAEALAARFDRLGLSPCHLSDVAEDLLAE